MDKASESENFIDNGESSPTVKVEGRAASTSSWRSFCTLKCCLISSAVLFLVSLAILGLGYYRYVSRLTGTATSEHSAEWEARLSNQSEPGDSLISGMYSLVSFDETYDDYLLAMGTPTFVLSLVKMSSEVVTVKAPIDSDGGYWHWRIKTDVRKDSWKFRLGEEFSVPWGRNKGFMHQVCEMKAPHELVCEKEEREKGWKLVSTRSFSGEGFMERLDFISANVTTKKYYQRTSKSKLEAKRKELANDPEAPFSSDTNDDEDFWDDDDEGW
eukprot:maker-scaffold804_size94796-snap-gene-0.14 protein:Tk06334 transcript:maker-scaffold804_size94796-snap-gene-0.14-mRNA-1 annotation:"fatty acid binding protein"